MDNIIRPMAENEESIVKSAYQVDKEFKDYMYDMVVSEGWSIIKRPKCIKPWTTRIGSFDMEIPELNTTVELKYEWGVGGSVRDKWFAFPSLIAWAVRKGHLHTKRSILVIQVDTRTDRDKGGLSDEMHYILEIKEQCKFSSTSSHEILALTIEEFKNWLSEMRLNCTKGTTD